MRIYFKTTCVVDLEHNLKTNKAYHVNTKVRLDVSNNLDIRQYIDEDGLPTSHGSEALINNLIQGLIGNIHLAHQKGWKNDAENLRYIISELERGFIENVNIDTSTL